VGAITPFERALVWVESGSGNIWRNYFYLRGVRAENRELKQQIEQMRLEQVRLSEDAAQAHRLQNMLAFKEQFISKTVAAQVIGTSGTDSNRVIYIDKGRESGIERDMAVMTADGIVGKVLLVYPSVAQVLLISDQTSGVGVILGGDRLQGWLGGSATGEVVLNDVMSDEQVPVGEKVLTSGGDRIFPKGLPVGTVAKVGKGKDLFLSIKVKPAANLSRLEEVLVLVEKQERQATAEDNVRVRAADILAARLPSVPDKPADAPAGAEGAPKPATSASLNAAQGSTVTTPHPASASTGAASSAGVPAPKKAAASPPSAETPNQTPKLTTVSPKPSIMVVSDSSGAKTTPSKTAAPTGASAKPAIVPAKPAVSQPKPVQPPPPSSQQPASDQSSPQ
jgi:rod shape-determining protein MreC